MIKGFIAGAFDLIHPGYVYMFANAKEHCDHLIIALQTDPTIDRPEKMKPVNTYRERIVVLRSIRYVDTVFPYTTEEDLVEVLKYCNPDIRFLGDDYRDVSKTKITGYLECEDIRFIGRSHGYSTTKLKDKIVESYKNE
jgi:glycerol-3-phosphate cytidylyltransferase